MRKLGWAYRAMLEQRAAYVNEVTTRSFGGIGVGTVCSGESHVQYTTSGLGVLLIMLAHDLDPTRAGPVSLLACWVSMSLSLVWYGEMAQSLIVTCYV